MKMKIRKQKSYLLIFLITSLIQPIYILSIRLSDENKNLLRLNKNNDFYNENYLQDNYEIPRMIRNSNSLLNLNQRISPEIINNNQMNLSLDNPSNNPALSSRMKKQSEIININPNSGWRVADCPCYSKVKCQPCGIIPKINLSIKNNFECPCAPKPNCAVCPPLSLIHDIASKKVKLNVLNRHDKINYWLQI